MLKNELMLMSEKHIDYVKPFERLFKLLYLFKRDILYIYVYAFFNGIITLSLPLGIQAIISIITSQQISTSWFVLVLVISIGIVLSGILSIFQYSIIENIQQNVFARSALDFSHRIPRFKPDSIYKYYPPQLINRFFDVINVQKGLPKIIMDFATSALQIIFGLILISFYHSLFVVFGLILITCLLLLFYFTFRPSLKTSLEESNYKYEVAGWLQELARTMATFKLAGFNYLSYDKTDAGTVKYIKARKAHFRMNLYLYLGNTLFKTFITATLLVLGSYLVIAQEINIGQFVAAEIIVLLIANSVDKFVSGMPIIYDTLTALEKIGYVTDIRLENVGGHKFEDYCIDNKLDIILNDLSYIFPDTSNYVLKNVSITIKSGEKLCILGNKGSGKSTLINFICGFYDKFEGQMLYNNIPLSGIDLDSLRTNIGDNTRDQDIFFGSISDNITVGLETKQERINEILTICGLDKFVYSQIDGLDTILHHEGRKLSRTIIKKIILARSIIKNPSILLFDEYDFDFDKEEKIRIINYLTSPERTWTIVANTLDYEFIKHCDRIVVFNNGSIQDDFLINELDSKEEFLKMLKKESNI